MSKIFISYSRDESSRADQLATALEHQGFSVWRDSQLASGDAWATQIEQELDQAECVVVLWSRNSIRSDWVRDEAAYAAEEGKLIPVFIDRVTPPLGFQHIISADLSDWTGDVSHPAFRRLVEGVAEKLEGRRQTDHPLKVFISHGHDIETKEAVRKLVQELGGEVTVSEEQVSSGTTLLERFERSADVDLAIAILSPDETTTPVLDRGAPRYVARQNVLLELGFFLAKLGASRLCVLHKSGVNLPTRMQGLPLIEVDQKGEWKKELAKVVEAASLQHSANEERGLE